MKQHDTFGMFVCEGDVLAYRSAAGAWSLPVRDIKVIAEHAERCGPLLDDYFFLFITAPDAGWHRASFYAAGRDLMLEFLEARLGAPIETGLGGFTDFRSRILWPPALRNMPLGESGGPRGFVLSPAVRGVFRA